MRAFDRIQSDKDSNFRIDVRRNNGIVDIDKILRALNTQTRVTVGVIGLLCISWKPLLSVIRVHSATSKPCEPKSVKSTYNTVKRKQIRIITGYYQLPRIRSATGWPCQTKLVKSSQDAVYRR